jgi:predicted ATPase
MLLAVRRVGKIGLRRLPEAAAVNPRFTLTAATAPAVAAICQRLEGIPLAIELAAARIQALTVEQISERLSDRFRLLTGRSRTGLDRHQTLRATVDWSHALLTEAERVLLRRLSVFAGGFRLDAAEQVCGEGGIQPAEILDLLSLPVTKSLVLLETEVGEGRYRLLETIREYALEKLKDASEEAELRRLHRRWCLDFAEHAEPRLRGPDQPLWLDRLHAELDNFRAAFGWSIAGQEPEGALRLASALLAFWIVWADWSEGREWVDTALGLPGEVDAAIRMKALRRRRAGRRAERLSQRDRGLRGGPRLCPPLARPAGNRGGPVRPGPRGEPSGESHGCPSAAR